MKLITINVSDEEHKKIKLEATKSGQSIKDYLLRPVGKPLGEYNDGHAITESAKPIKGGEWSGPIFRDKKKGKL